MPTHPSQKAIGQVEKLRAALEAVGDICFTTVREYLDSLTKTHLGFVDFSALVRSKHTPYIPFKPDFEVSDYFKKVYAELDFLALAYDMAQEVRGDYRRAYRS